MTATTCAILHILPGAILVVALLYVTIFRPLLRDRMLISSWFLPIVITTAILIPISVYGILLLVGANSQSLWSDSGYEPSLAWSVYYHFVNQGSQHMAMSEYIVATTTLSILGTLLLNGLLISSLISFVDRRKDSWLKGEVRYSSWFIRRHTIVIGGSDVAIGIVRDIVAKRRRDESHRCRLSRIGRRAVNALFGKEPIVILAKCNIERLRNNLKSEVSDISDIVIYYGSRTSQQDIESLHPDKAKEIFVIGEDIFNKNNDDESYHDTLNIKCLQLLGRASKNHTKGTIDCHVMFEYQTTFAALQISDIDSKKIKFRPFNYYEAWALKVFGGDTPKKENSKGYIPLDGNGITREDDKFVHLIVVGMSRMGIATANMAAHIAHYPNFESKKLRTRISFIDINVEQEAQYYMGRFNELFKYARYRFLNTSKSEEWCCKMEQYNPNGYLGEDFIDVEWEFVGGAVDSKEVRDYLEKSANDDSAKLTIAICLPESNRAVATAIYMPDIVYEKAQEILVYQRNGGEVIEQISESNFHYHKKLRPFGMDNECYDIEQYDLVDFIADRVGQEWEKANDEYCMQMPKKSEKSETTDKNKEKKVSKSMSSKLWSNYYNTYSARGKFRSCGKAYSPDGDSSIADFTKDELELMARVEHNRWVVEQLLMRYRPLTLDEQESAKREGANISNERKQELKAMGAHLNICSNAMLDKLDKGIAKMDSRLVRVLPKAFNDFKNNHKKTDSH